ncbi:MAG: acetyl-CoA carboxylase biotin carboxyl carrier protein [Planctomycetaceae bacterium]|nr:acetyl-CoA carboxylase biotin carboxyl carrier protein [Planctomycetaceae bacterium]
MSEVGPDSEVFEVNRIKSLIKLMRENDLNEIDLKHGERRIRLRKGDLTAPVVVGAPAYAPAPYPTPSAPAAPAAAPVAAPAAATADDDANATFIKSPMVGTFYSKPNPDAKPYVQVGDQVTPETIVCQIEAMKMFSEIPAGVTGTIKAILVKNQEAVDVNKPMFKIV